METTSKTCAACKEEKPVTDFHKSKNMKDGIRSSCKECVKVFNRQSVARHREKRLAEKRADYYKKKDDPEFKEKIKTYQDANKDRKAEYDRQYRARDPEKQRWYTQNWNDKNPDKRRAIERNYRDRRRAQTKDGVSTAELSEWTKRQKKVCYWCGKKCGKGFHIDHYEPLSKGGRHVLANLVISCGPCNLKKNAKDPLAFAQEIGRLF
jgi:5-methylcytosine-specific restriction endonuclease McrA